jgi:hypothetical protein
MMFTPTALIAYYFIGAGLSTFALSLLVWIQTRSFLATWLVAVLWLTVSAILFTVYRLVLNHG